MNIAWAAEGVNATKVSINTNSLDAILQASPVVQLTLLILIIMSLFCWAIAIAKYSQFKKIKSSNEPFLNRFWKAKSLESLYEDIDQFEDSPLARVFKAGVEEIQSLASTQSKEEGKSLRISGVDNLERTLRKAVDLEVSHMENKLTLLATTGSTGPFIGLFGTVWGIMGSFHKIGATGSASLAVVAPGISEALVATAIGLAAAIPAVVLYNNFLAQIKRQETELNNFLSDFLNIVKRSFFQES